jgi:dienelactone hydrolase
MMAILAARCLLLLTGATQDAAQPSPPEVGSAPAPASWLVLEAVDGRGRRPLRPDAVFAEFLAVPGRESPLEGAALVGESGGASWREVAAGAGGGPEQAGAYAFARLDVAAEQAGVWLARLPGATQFFLDGRPFVGDPYRYGHGGVPVELAAGSHGLFVTGIRGGFDFALHRPAGPVTLEARDLLLPDLVVGEGGSFALGAVLHRSAVHRLSGARVEVVGGKLRGAVELEPLEALSTTVVALTVEVCDARDVAAPGRIAGELRVLSPVGEELARLPFEVAVLEPAAPRLRSFLSRIDGSVQVYGELAPRTVGEELPGLVLSLHGASVAARSQIGSYAATEDLWIVAPTNRRPFGFDWQDWGRRDAYEARDHFLSRVAVSPLRRYLTGHSMGGHGTWHLAANDPDQWAAIAPSAGWRSFDTYGGRPGGPLLDWWQRADGASLTSNLLANLRALPTFVLHGEADDNVPASEARAMVEALTAAGAPDLASHFEPGAGHWWDGDRSPGADCLQWPALFELFARTRMPAREGADTPLPAQLEFVTVDPAVDSRHHWLAVTAVQRVGSPARVTAHWTAAELTLATENVARLELDALAAAPGLRLAIDGQELTVPEGEARPRWLERGADGFAFTDQPLARSARRPDRSGPFKRAFDREFVLVRGTAGSEAEAEGLRQLALYHAQEWWYRAQGRAPLLTDREFLARPDLAHCNVILYGNRDTNSAWRAVLGDEVPVFARRGNLHLGELQLYGFDRALCLVYPRQGSDLALVGVFGDTGAAGTRLHLLGAPFVSGVGIPDYLAYDSGVLTAGEGGTVYTGFFDRDWRLDPDNQTRP